MKRISIIFLISLPLLLTSACGQAAPAAAASSSASAADITLADITDANAGGALLEKYSLLSVEYSEYGPDGSVVFTQTAQMKSSENGDYVYRADYNGEGSELETGCIYCVYDAESGESQFYALTPETYASDISTMLSTLVFTAAEDEKITSASEDGDNYIIETTAGVSDDVKDYIKSSFGAAPDSMNYRIVLNKADLLVLSSSTYAVCGSDTYKVADFIHTCGGDFTVPDFADALINSADSKITVMLGDSVCCEYSVPAGTSLLTDFFSYDGYTLCADKSGGSAVDTLEAGNTYYLVASK